MFGLNWMRRSIDWSVLGCTYMHTCVYACTSDAHIARFRQLRTLTMCPLVTAAGVRSSACDAMLLLACQMWCVGRGVASAAAASSHDRGGVAGCVGRSIKDQGVCVMMLLYRSVPAISISVARRRLPPNRRRLRDCALIGQACAGRGFGCGVLGRRESRELNQRRRSWCWRPWVWASISISKSMQAGIARLRMHRPISTAKNAALASSRQCVLLSFDRRHQF